MVMNFTVNINKRANSPKTDEPVEQRKHNDPAQNSGHLKLEKLEAELFADNLKDSQSKRKRRTRANLYLYLVTTHCKRESHLCMDSYDPDSQVFIKSSSISLELETT